MRLPSDLLAQLAARQADAWEEAEALVRTRKLTAYDQAVQLLMDFAELAERDGATEAYLQQIRATWNRHAQNGIFITRLVRANLPIEAT